MQERSLKVKIMDKWYITDSEQYRQFRELKRIKEEMKHVKIKKDVLRSWIRQLQAADGEKSLKVFSGLKEDEWADLNWERLNFKKLIGADLSGADLSGADLSGANLRCANLSLCNLRCADLRGTHLFGADLSRANLFRADIKGAQLIDADLNGASMQGVYNKEKARFVAGNIIFNKEDSNA